MSKFFDAPSVVEQLTRIYPEGIVRLGKGEMWNLKLSESDARAEACLKCLKDSGYRPWVDRGRMPIKGKEFTIDILRDYEDADLDPCRLLGLLPTEYADIENPRFQGRIRIGEYIDGFGKWNPKAAPIQSTSGSYTIVADHVKRLLESSDLKGITFKPTWFIPARYRNKIKDDTAFPWDEFGEPWWEMSTNLFMPPMSPSAVIIDNRWNRITDRSQFHLGALQREALGTIEALVDPVEPRYLKSEIDAMDDFDFARTHEFGIPQIPDGGYHPIVSNRFYRFCRDNNFNCNFVPVRLD